MGAKVIKLGSWDKCPAYCKDLNVNVWHMCSGKNVMVYFKPGKWLRMMYYSVSDTGILGKKEIRVLLSGVEPKTF